MERFGYWFNKYLQLRRAMNISEATLRTEVSFNEQFWKYLVANGFEGKDELAVKKEDIMSYSKHINSQEHLKLNSKRNYIGTLFSFYHEAARQDWIMTDPTLGLDYPKKSKNPPFVLSYKQVREFIEAPDLSTVKGYRDRVCFELMYSCGLRNSEVIKVKIDDFSDEFRRLKVFGKGKKEAILPITRIGAQFTKNYVEHIMPKFDKHKTNYLFLSTRSRKPLDTVTLISMVKKYGRQLGYSQNITPHTFRYSVCTHLDEAGMEIRVLQEFMRHDSANTTVGYIKQNFKKLQSVHQKAHPRELGQ